MIEVVETYEGSIGAHLGLRNAVLKEEGLNPTSATAPAKEAALKKARAEYLSCLLLSGADNLRYKSLKEDLSNDYLKGKDAYPKTYEATLKLLNNYKGRKQLGNFQRNDQSGVAFIQQGGGERKNNNEGAPKKKTNKSGRSDCFHCGADDHWERD